MIPIPVRGGELEAAGEYIDFEYLPAEETWRNDGWRIGYPGEFDAFQTYSCVRRGSE